ncbi:hypothetical protein P7K49_006035 [Saguinus oedipus]|uniref:Uncharacterized protein n=1 Tax=Saguinus oedipus TaxID=9490 RepID=A0ABQ9W193_SAGOE|nr:hypothetical protein P7K49_006035 [Saguinus oedipus]
MGDGAEPGHDAESGTYMASKTKQCETHILPSLSSPKKAPSLPLSGKYDHPLISQFDPRNAIPQLARLSHRPTPGANRAADAT